MLPPPVRSLKECGAVRFSRLPSIPIVNGMREDINRLGLVEEDEIALD